MYTDQQKREIERVLTVFKPFIDQADYLEIVWSNKRQCYVSLFIDTTRGCFDGADEIHSAEEICDKCYTEIGNTSFLKTTASMNFGRCISWSETSFCAAFSRMMRSCRSITT